MQGHSTASTLPPLPENGPTHETEVQEVETKGGDESPLPSATTSPMEEVEEEEVDEVQTEDPAAPDHVSEVPIRKRRRVAQGLSSSVSSPAKEADLKDDGDSGSPPPAKAAPLTVCPLSSAPPPQSGEALLFGGPIFDDPDSEEDGEYMCAPLLPVLRFCWLILLLMLFYPCYS